MFFEQYSHEPNIAVLRFWALHPDAATPTQAETEAKLTAGYAALDALERHLRSNEFLVADRYSVADISLYAYTHVAEDGGFDLERYPRLREWLLRVRAQPGHVGIDA